MREPFLNRLWLLRVQTFQKPAQLLIRKDTWTDTNGVEWNQEVK